VTLRHLECGRTVDADSIALGMLAARSLIIGGMHVPADVSAFIGGLTPARRRDDALELLSLFAGATGQDPHMAYASIIGFGSYEYTASGRAQTGPAAAFAPRSRENVVYLSPGFAARTPLLERLGPHRTGVGCLYLGRVATIDLDVLRAIVAESYEAVTR
jgi:hypothetical protein